MRQQTLAAQTGFEKYGRKTKRERFLEEMEQPEPWVEAIKEPGSSAQQFDLHARNFLDCVKSRQRPIADVEGGHQTTTACHLANLSLRLGRKLKWDPVKEEI